MCQVLKYSLTFVFGFALILSALSLNAKAQVRPIYDQGTLGLVQILKRINTTASVMMIGAHPDDEDTALLAYLARGENARTAYLSLTRGDGGQNILGSELGESLGIIRTEELLQARELDGAEQYFTRAYDYGFSKTLDEAKRKWDEKVILCDVVQAIRTFHPLVVVSQFSGTPNDGHGQHQYSGYISPLAVKAAADIGQCKESGPTWEVRKFYMRHRGAGEPTIRINTGKYATLLGRSYFEIAMEARSQHKSQEQGVLELKGDQFSGLDLVNLTKVQSETSIFDGIDISVQPANSAVAESTDKVLREYDPNNPQKIAALLGDGYSANQTTLGPIRKDKDRELKEAIKLAAGVRIDALSDNETVVPGEHFGVAVKIFFPSNENITVKNISLEGCQSSKIAQPEANPNVFRRETATESAYFDAFTVKNVQITQPYWLVEKRNGDLFNWQNADSTTLPFQISPFNAVVEFEIYGKPYRFSQHVEYRFAEATRGEIRREFNVVPAVSVSLGEDFIIVPAGIKQRKITIIMNVKNNAVNGSKGLASLNLPKNSGWKISPESQPFELTKKNETVAVMFTITIPSNTKNNSYPVSAKAVTADGNFTQGMNTIDYPHIQTHRFYTDAETKVAVMDLKTVPVKIGYVAGSGDKVPEAIARMGLTVTMLDEKELTIGDLSSYDVIVVGIRASEVRPDFAANNKKLLEFAGNGGTLIVQYQRPVYAQQGLAPFPVQMGPRVVDENAKVTILQPENPVFNFPNKISDTDFEGWVQERNLYNFSTFDDKYTPLLESHDAGEPENKGGLVIADIGKGKYVYCSYSMFRQLPAGVQGAYRLFANLLSLSRRKNS